MISIRDADKERLEEIVELLSIDSVSLTGVLKAHDLAREVLENINDLMRPAKIGY